MINHLFCDSFADLLSTEEAASKRQSDKKVLKENQNLIGKLPQNTNFSSKMNRLFGKGKAKEPPPNLTDCIANVSLILISIFF